MRRVGSAFAVAAVLASACNRNPTAEPAPGPPPVQAAAPEIDASPLTETMIETSAGPLTITPLHHASFLLGFGGKVIAVDPTMDALRKYPPLPKANYVFITDIHPDHLDKEAIEKVKAKEAIVVGPNVVGARVPVSVPLQNGMHQDFGLFSVEAVAMYNIAHQDAGAGPHDPIYHDRGRGDGFVFTFADKRIYVSGDTECTPEVKALQNIDVALLCMNMPYTMPPSEAAACARIFKPKIVYPYHYKGEDPGEFAKAVSGAPIEVRLRSWY